MSSYLRNLLQNADADDDKATVKKKLPTWLGVIQSARPVTYDTSELYEEKVDEMEKLKKKQSEQQLQTKKCYECDDYGHIAKECPNKLKKKHGARFKESDWSCPMCANINWDWRTHCNKCSTPKPSGSNAEKRTGKGGGYNEIDEETRERMRNRNSKQQTTKKDGSVEGGIAAAGKDKSGGGGGGEDERSVYISNLPTEYTATGDGEVKEFGEQELVARIAQHFGQIGRIKKRNRYSRGGGAAAGGSGGHFDIVLSNQNRNAKLVYEDPHTAPFAISWFNNTEFERSRIEVKLKKDIGEHEEEYFDECGAADSENDGGGGGHHSNDDAEDDAERPQEAAEESVTENGDANEMAVLEAELFGFSRRGRGRGKHRVNQSRHNRAKIDAVKTKSKSRSRSRSRTRSRSPKTRSHHHHHEDRYTSREKDRHRSDQTNGRDREKRYRASRTSNGHRR